MGILISWLGLSDQRALSSGDFTNSALGSIYTHQKPSKLILFSTASAKELKQLDSILDCEIISVKSKLTSPMDYQGIYNIVNLKLGKLTLDPKIELSYNISSGTQAMSFVFFMLGNSLFPGKFYQSSVEAGAQEVILPFDIVASFIPSVLEKQKSSDIGKMKDVHEIEGAFVNIIHKSDAMKLVIHKAKTLAKTDYPVLIKGETGTGKELFAQAIHQSSTRSNKNFVAINCGALSETLLEAELFGYSKGAFTGASSDKKGLLQQADGGTVFLDELGEMSLPMQVKLLRFLQEDEIRPVGSQDTIKVNVRVIAATHKDLMAMSLTNEFRQDLIFRLAVGVLEIPPLRDRPGDVDLLVQHFLAQASQETGSSICKKISKDVKDFTQKQPWNGNVREIQNFIRRCVLWSKENVIQIDEAKAQVLSMPSQGTKFAEITSNFDINEEIEALKEHYIQEALSKTGNNKSQAAKLLGLANHQTLNNWMEKSLLIFLACNSLFNLSETFLKGIYYV